MTLDEAIETLKHLEDPDYFLISTNERLSIQLGIEALEFFKKFQQVTGSHQDARLPSETTN